MCTSVEDSIRMLRIEFQPAACAAQRAATPRTSCGPRRLRLCVCPWHYPARRGRCPQCATVARRRCNVDCAARCNVDWAARCNVDCAARCNGCGRNGPGQAAGGGRGPAHSPRTARPARSASRCQPRRGSRSAQCRTAATPRGARRRCNAANDVATQRSARLTQRGTLQHITARRNVPRCAATCRRAPQRSQRGSAAGLCLGLFASSPPSKWREPSAVATCRRRKRRGARGATGYNKTGRVCAPRRSTPVRRTTLHARGADAMQANRGEQTNAAEASKGNRAKKTSRSRGEHTSMRSWANGDGLQAVLAR